MAEPVDSAAHVMWSPGQIAERDGVSKQAVSKMLGKLVADHGIPVERDSRGRIATVSVAHYDHHRGVFGNSAKTPSRATSPQQMVESDSRDEAARQREWLALDRDRLKHQAEAGAVIRADKEAEALGIAGRAIQSEVNRLQNKADDVALAVSKEGVHGARLILREIAFDLNTRIADALAAIAATAPELDAPIEDLVG